MVAIGRHQYPPLTNRGQTVTYKPNGDFQGFDGCNEFWVEGGGSGQTLAGCRFFEELPDGSVDYNSSVSTHRREVDFQQAVHRGTYKLKVGNWLLIVYASNWTVNLLIFEPSP